MNLGTTIRICRQQRGLSQSALAQASGVSVSHLSLLEHDKREPSLQTIEAIARVLEIPIGILLFLAAKADDVSELTAVQIDQLTQSIYGLLDGISRQKALFE